MASTTIQLDTQSKPATTTTSTSGLVLPSAKPSKAATAATPGKPEVEGDKKDADKPETEKERHARNRQWKDMLTVASIFAHQKGFMSTLSMVLSVLMLQGGTLGEGASADSTTDTTGGTKTPTTT